MSSDATPPTSLVFVQWEAPTFGFVRVSIPDSAAPEIVQQFRVHNPDFKSQSAQTQGRWLAKQLRNNGIATRNIRIVLPRRYASTRLLDLPTGVDQEIADICKLQLKTESSGERTEAIGDYLKIPLAPPHGTQASPSTKVFLASVSNRQLEPVLDATQKAGVVVDGIHIAEFSLSTEDTGRSSGVALQVLRRKERIEFVVCDQGVPLSAQTFPYLDDGDDVASVMPALGGRVLRSLGDDVAKRLNQVSLYGDEVASLASHFEDFFGIPVSHDRRLASQDFPILSLATCLARQTPVLNFAAPKTSNEEAATSKWPWQYAVAAAIGLLAIGLYAGNHVTRSQVAQLRQEVKQAEKTIANPTVRNEANKYQFVTNWQSRTINWSERLSKLAPAVGTGERSYLESIRINTARDATATVDATGYAVDPESVFAINKAIREQPEFKLDPQSVSTSDSEGRFGTKFSLRVTSSPAVVTP